jgi:hypothetical protein
MIEHFLENLWRWKCDMPEIESRELPSLDILQKTEWSEEFERLMRNRLIMGSFRYGSMGHGSHPTGKPLYDRCASIKHRISEFEQTGNAEHLVDIANVALLIFEERTHPKFHFSAADDNPNVYHDKIISHGYK